MAMNISNTYDSLEATLFEMVLLHYSYSIYLCYSSQLCFVYIRNELILLVNYMYSFLNSAPSHAPWMAKKTGTSKGASSRTTTFGNSTFPKSYLQGSTCFSRVILMTLWWRQLFSTLSRRFQLMIQLQVRNFNRSTRIMMIFHLPTYLVHLNQLIVFAVFQTHRHEKLHFCRCTSSRVKHTQICAFFLVCSRHEE